MPDLNSEAATVREIIEDVGGRMQRGERGWQQRLEEARTVADAITHRASRLDAEMRVANIDHLVALYGGRPRDALRHLDRCLEITSELRRTATGSDVNRLDDHEWGILLNRCQVWQALGDLDRAQKDVERSLTLAETSLEPAAHRVMTLTSAAAIRAEREDWAGALRLYHDLVEQARLHAPDTLGTALLSLAQCQAKSGAWQEASRNADRAEPLLTEVSSRASLHQLRGFIAMGLHDLDAVERHLTAHAEFTAEHQGLLETHHASEAMKAQAFAAHSRGDLKRACRIYRDAIAAARADDDPLRLISVLTQGSGAIQDLGLSRLPSRLGRRSLPLHHEALAQTDEASRLAHSVGRTLLAAALDVQYAKYVAQWHTVITRANTATVASALERCLAATVFLHRDSFRAERSEDRRAAAGKYASEAFDISFALAFRLGFAAVVAELVELRCATGELPHHDGSVGLGDLVQLAGDTDGAGDPDGTGGPDAPGEVDDPDPGASTLGAATATKVRAGLLLAPPPPLEFTPGRTVLAGAFEQAGIRYGMAHDERAPLHSW